MEGGGEGRGGDGPRGEKIFLSCGSERTHTSPLFYLVKMW